MFLNYVIGLTLWSISQCCTSRNELIQYSYNIENQPNIIPLGLLFEGSALNFNISLNSSQKYQIYQSFDSISTNSTIQSQIVAISEFPIVVDTQVQIQLAILSDNYAISIVIWVDSKLQQSQQYVTIQNQQNCNRIAHMSQTSIAILCQNNILLYNTTSQLYTVTQIPTPTFQPILYWLKSISEETIYVSYSDLDDNFISMGFIYQNSTFTKINTIQEQGVISGFEIYGEQSYFLLINNTLLYQEKENLTQFNLTFNQLTYLSVYSALNKLGEVHFYVGLINSNSLIQFIYDTVGQQTLSTFIQNFTLLPLSIQPTLFIDQYYFIMQSGMQLYGFVGYDNQQFKISPLFYKSIPNYSAITYLSYADQIVLYSPYQYTIYQVNQPILIFKKPQNPTDQQIIFNYTIIANSTLNPNDNCYQNFTQQSISEQFSQVQQQQNCSQIDITLFNPQIKQIDVGNCAIGPNITYLAGTYVEIEGLSIDNQIGAYTINDTFEFELFFEELAIYQINSIYTFKSQPREFTYFTYLKNPLNEKQYIQLIQFNDFQVEFQICDQWVCQNTTELSLEYRITMSQIGADIGKRADSILLITNANTSYSLFIYEFENWPEYQLKILDLSESLGIDQTFTIEQIMLSGPYLYIIIDDPNYLVIYNIQNFELVNCITKLQPRKLVQNYESYGDNIFLDNTINLIIFEMIDDQFTIGAKINYPPTSTSVSIGLLKNGVYIALSNEGESELLYYSRQLLFQSIIDESLVISIPLYDGQFIQPMVSSFSEQFFYIQMLMPDTSIQLCIFKSDYNLLYLTYYFKEQFNSISVIQVNTLQNYDLIGFQSPLEFTILQNYWQVSVILNSEFLVPGIQLLNDTQILLQCSNNFLEDYYISFPVSVNNTYYEIQRTNLIYPLVNETRYNFSISVNPLQYFNGSIIHYDVRSRGKNIAYIKQDIIDYYLDFEQPVNSACYSSSKSQIYAINNQYVVQYNILQNTTSVRMYINNNQYTTCPLIFVEYSQQYPITICTNTTDTYFFISESKIYPIYNLTGKAQPNLMQGYYQDYILILGFNVQQNCLGITTYYVTWNGDFSIQILESTENCVYQLFTFTMLNLNLNPNNITTQQQCAGWIGITDDISTFPFHYTCFNFSTNITSQTYTPKQLFIQSILSNTIQLKQISQIGLPVVGSNYSEITLLFASQNNAYSFIVQIYSDGVVIQDNLLIFQQFSNQKAVQTVSGFNQQGQLTVLTMFLQQVGSQIFQTICVYQPFEFNSKLKVVEFLFCRTLHYAIPYTKKYIPFLFFLTDNLVLTNQHFLILSQELTIEVYAFPHTDSFVYLNASNFDSFQNLTISIIQTDLERKYTEWIVFAILSVISIAIIWGYQYIKKFRNVNIDTENYIEL